MIYYQYSRKDILHTAVINYDKQLREEKELSLKDRELLDGLLNCISGNTDQNTDTLLVELLHCYKFKSVERIDTGAVSDFTDQIRSSDRFNTFELLEFLLLTFIENATAKECFKDRDAYLNLLLAKIEVTGKLFEEYTWSTGKGSGNYVIVDNYILLSVNLLMSYRLNSELKTLNAVLKVNDLLDIFIHRNSIHADSMPLIIYSFYSEVKEMEILYEAQGFRLSTH